MQNNSDFHETMRSLIFGIVVMAVLVFVYLALSLMAKVEAKDVDVYPTVEACYQSDEYQLYSDPCCMPYQGGWSVSIHEGAACMALESEPKGRNKKGENNNGK